MTETRAFTAALEIRAGGDGRTVTGLVAPFHMPTSIGGRFTEVFGPGSFRLAPVALHSGHPRDDRDMPVSPPGRVWEQRDGVAGEWHLSRTTAADDLLALIGDDPPAISGLSVGFAPDEDADLWSDDRRLVTRRGAELLHVAAVPRAAYAAARVTSVRSGPPGVNGLPAAARLTAARVTMTGRAALEALDHRRVLYRAEERAYPLDGRHALQRLTRSYR